MILRQDLQRLASLWSDAQNAISLYFPSKTPADVAHREEPILVKEQIHEKLGTRKVKSQGERDDIARLLEMAASFKGNHGRARVVFACGDHGVWQEFDLTGSFNLRLDVGPAFTLAPLVQELESMRRYCIALADRSYERIFMLVSDQVTGDTNVLEEKHDPIRTTGAGMSTQRERHKEKPAIERFKALAEHLLRSYEHDEFDALLIGCRSDLRSEIESELSNVLRRVLIGHFHIDPGLATPKETRDRALALIAQESSREESMMVDQAIGEARRGGLGVVGLAAVLDALDKAEVRTLLFSQKRLASSEGSARASICTNCSHIQSGTVAVCEVCGNPMHTIANAEEALLRHRSSRDTDLRVIRNATLPDPDNIAALLRFRVERTHAVA
jgi:Bacterial archaeo-eukaryotic release factor family 10